MGRTSHRAFTLIELLVVLAVIALLMGILIPALQRVKEGSRDVVCKSNLRSIGLGITAYLQDNDSYHFYEALGALLKTGPTGTNVCDLQIVIIE